MSFTPGPLSQSQIRALRWINENPSTSSGWLCGGKPVKHQHPDKWDQMEIRGEQGSIRIAAADLKQLLPFVTHCTAPDKLYDLNKEGRAALTKAEGHIGQELAPDANGDEG
jgi:hypothetical protein